MVITLHLMMTGIDFLYSFVVVFCKKRSIGKISKMGWLDNKQQRQGAVGDLPEVSPP